MKKRKNHARVVVGRELCGLKTNQNATSVTALARNRRVKNETLVLNRLGYHESERKGASCIFTTAFVQTAFQYLHYGVT